MSKFSWIILLVIGLVAVCCEACRNTSATSAATAAHQSYTIDASDYDYITKIIYPATTVPSIPTATQYLSILNGSFASVTPTPAAVSRSEPSGLHPRSHDTITITTTAHTTHAHAARDTTTAQLADSRSHHTDTVSPLPSWWQQVRLVGITVFIALFMLIFLHLARDSMH